MKVDSQQTNKKIQGWGVSTPNFSLECIFMSNKLLPFVMEILKDLLTISWQKYECGTSGRRNTFSFWLASSHDLAIFVVSASLSPALKNYCTPDASYYQT